MRCPNPHNEATEEEIRQVFAAEDFGEALTPVLRAQQERIIMDVKKNNTGWSAQRRKS